MPEFEIANDGQVRETSVRTGVAKLKELFPEIDSAALEANLMLQRAHNTLMNVRSPHWAKQGITGLRLNVLRLLYLADGRRLTMGEIAADLNRGTPNVTQLIDGLEREGLVRRISTPEDKRVVYAQLTPLGEERFASVFPANALTLKEAWAPLSDREKGLLVHLLARLRVHLLASNLGASPERTEADLRSAGDPDAPRSSRPARRRHSGSRI